MTKGPCVDSIESRPLVCFFLQVLVEEEILFFWWGGGGES